MPERVQLSRRRGWRMPANTVEVDRSTGYGNPFVVGEVPGQHIAAAVGHGPWPVASTEEAVQLFRKLLMQNLARSDDVADRLLMLRGKNLACWCKPGATFHADVLLELANLPA